MKLWLVVSNILVALIGLVYIIEGLQVNNLDVKSLALLTFGIVNTVLAVLKK